MTSRRFMRSLAAMVLVVGASVGFGPVPPSSGAITYTVAPTVTPLGITSFGDIAVDPATGRVVVSGGDQVIITEPDGSVVEVIPLAGATGLAIDGSDLWVSQTTVGQVSRIDLDALVLDETYTIGTSVGSTIAVVGDVVVFTGAQNGRSFSLLRLEPGTGVVDNLGGSTYGGRIAAIPGSNDHVLFYDTGISPYSVFRTDVGGDSAIKEADVPFSVGSSMREVVAIDPATFVTAAGDPDHLTEFDLATMDTTGQTYGGHLYPVAVAYTPHAGGVLAAMSTAMGRVTIYRVGSEYERIRVSPAYTMQERGLEIAPDASAVYVVTGTSSLELHVFSFAPVVDEIVPAAVAEGAATTIELFGASFSHVSAVFIDGASVPFVRGSTLKVDVPGSLVAGSHTMFITSMYGSLTTTLLVANLPSAPTAPVAVPGPNQATVSWTPPDDDGGTPITSYEVRSLPDVADCTASGSSCVVNGLVNGDAYVFSVRAINAAGAGAWSDWSATVGPSSVPLAPAPPTAVAGDSTADVSWLAPSAEGSPIVGYEVRTMPSTGGCVAIGLSCEVEGLTNGLPYQLSVRALNAIGAGPWSLWSDAVTPTGCGSPEGPFSDVSGTTRFCRDIEWLVARQITNGYSDGTFHPASRITRMSVGAMLYRYEYEPSFAPPILPTFGDVDAAHPFFAEIEWLVAEGFAHGFADGTFRPTTAVSRQSLAALLYRLSGSPAFAPAGQTFTDVPLSHPFYVEIEWLAASGIAGGYVDGTFRGSGSISRQALGAFLHRLSLL